MTDQLLWKSPDALAQTIASLAPLTLRSTELALRRLQGTVVKNQGFILMCYQSAKFRDVTEAFLAKRPSIWTGT